MVRYFIAGIIGGILFGVMDGLIHGNPMAQSLHEVYQPIARKSINFQMGILIDFVYGFVMASMFLLLYKSLPGQTSIMKGIVFAVIIWFFRILMNTASSFIMYNIPLKTLLYTLATGLGEMLILGLFFGLILKQ